MLLFGVILGKKILPKGLGKSLCSIQQGLWMFNFFNFHSGDISVEILIPLANVKINEVEHP